MAGENLVNNNGDPTAATARLLVRRGLKAALATLEKGSGHPYASLVTTATEPDGSPIFLISRLALHTQNLLVDARASLLFDCTDDKGDPLAGARATLMGQASPSTGATTRSRFLARHPAALSYIDFADFALYRLTLESAHFIGGFGRIASLAPADLLLPMGASADIIAAEAEIVAEINRDLSDEVQLLATRLAASPPGRWRITGVDPAGVDLMLGGHTRRIEFDAPVSTASAAQHQLRRLLTAAGASPRPSGH
jgi:putative heme iron utilization protein